MLRLHILKCCRILLWIGSQERWTIALKVIQNFQIIFYDVLFNKQESSGESPRMDLRKNL